MIIEILKLLLELFAIIIISKKLLVPIIRKLGESLKLKAHTIGVISGVATSIPEFLTVAFSTSSGLISAGIYNILSSNLINIIQYLLSVVINKNIRRNRNISSCLINKRSNR